MAQSQVYGDMEVPILQTKLHAPESLSPTIVRERLFARLDAGLKGKLILVRAPAGFGKTTLVSDWVRRLDVPVGWVCLEPGDNEPVRFWRYLAAALDKCYPGFLERVRQTIPLFGTAHYEQALVLFLNGLCRLPGKCCLVLDDFHFIQDGRIMQGVAYLIENLPRPVHLTLISRSLPAIELSRMEANETVLQLAAGELRFLEREGLQFYRDCMKLDWNETETASLVRKMGGWIAGMKLMALSNPSKKGLLDSLDPDIAYDVRQLESYLLEEVFRQQSASMQRFLMTCSILPRWSADLCQALTGLDCRPYIESLVRSQLFVVALDAEGEWYRFHAIFSEFLRMQLQKRAAGDGVELYAQAGQWYRQRNMDEEAVECFLAGRKYELAIGLLEEMTSRALSRSWSELRKWLASIPNEVLLAHPVLYFSYALSLSNSGQGHLAEIKLAEAERWYAANSSQWSEEQRDRYLGWIHYVRGDIMIFLHNDLPQAKQQFELSHKYAPEGVPLIYGSDDIPLQAVNVRSYPIGPGQASPEISIPYTMQMAEIFAKINPLFLSRLYINHSELLYLWDERKKAAQYAAQGLKWAEQLPVTSAHERISGSLVQARLKWAEGKDQAARQILTDCRLWLRTNRNHRGLFLIETELARIALFKGDRLAAEAWLDGWRLSPDDPVSVFQMFEYTVLARALVCLNRGEEAYTLLERLQALAERELRPIDEAEILAIQSLLLNRQGRRKDALLKVDEALAKAEQNLLLRVIVDEGDEMGKLLRDFVHSRRSGQLAGRCHSSMAFAGKALAGLAPKEAPYQGKESIRTLLTRREQEVLDCLFDDLSGKEIAEKLQIGYETVKTHISRIYAKLGVSSRVKAIERARELEH